MAIKGQPLTVGYIAWNTSTNSPATGDAANHALQLVQDGAATAPTNSPVEVGSAISPGLYKLSLIAGEMNYLCIILCGKSSTANVVIIPLVIITERGILPAGTSPGTLGGLLTAGTGFGQINPSGGNVTFNNTSIATAGSVTGSVGSIAGVTFPAHFGIMAIDTSGDVTFNNTSIPVVGTVGSVSGSVGSVTGGVGGNVAGSVGSIAGVTFPAHFSSLAIDTNGFVTFNNTSISSVGTVSGSISSVTTITGDVQGKVLGGGSSNFSGVGAQTAFAGLGF
jgi:hypothetical protein